MDTADVMDFPGYADRACAAYTLWEWPEDRPDIIKKLSKARFYLTYLPMTRGTSTLIAGVRDKNGVHRNKRFASLASAREVDRAYYEAWQWASEQIGVEYRPHHLPR